MTAVLVVVATPKSDYDVGDIVDCLDSSRDFGRKIVPPNWVKVYLTNVSVEDAQEFLDQTRTIFDYEEVSRTEEGVRYKVSVDRRVVDRFGANRGMREELFEFLKETYGAVKRPALSDPPFHYVVDIPDPDMDNAELKAVFEDVAVEVLRPVRYGFSAADVQQALDNGGELHVTKAVARDRLIDRLDEPGAQTRRRRR